LHRLLRKDDITGYIICVIQAYYRIYTFWHELWNTSLQKRNFRGGITMKKCTALLAVTAVAALSLAGQAFAFGGGMGGGSGRGSMGGGIGQGGMAGNSRMASTMPMVDGGGMSQHAMQTAGGMNGTMAGSGPNRMDQGATASGGHQHGQNHDGHTQHDALQSPSL
jgi:hypothetical protein